MAVLTPEQKIEKACINAKEKLESLGIEDKIQAELEYVIGSYGFDKNPVGLYEIGGKAYKALESFKTENPRKVSKKLLTDIEGALKLS
ncbi:MAG: hypothetical protein AAFQ94_22710 [Bacteroidota bacterium]